MLGILTETCWMHGLFSNSRTELRKSQTAAPAEPWHTPANVTQIWLSTFTRTSLCPIFSVSQASTDGSWLLAPGYTRENDRDWVGREKEELFRKSRAMMSIVHNLRLLFCDVGPHYIWMQWPKGFILTNVALFKKILERLSLKFRSWEQILL